MECGEILQPISVIEYLGIAIIGVKLSIAKFSSPKYGVKTTRFFITFWTDQCLHS